MKIEYKTMANNDKEFIFFSLLLNLKRFQQGFQYL